MGRASRSIENPPCSPKWDGTRIRKPSGTFWITPSMKRSGSESHLRRGRLEKYQRRRRIIHTRISSARERILRRDTSSWNMGRRSRTRVRRIISDVCSSLRTAFNQPAFVNEQIFHVIQGVVHVEVHTTSFMNCQGGRFLVPRSEVISMPHVCCWFSGNHYYVKNDCERMAKYFSLSIAIPQRVKGVARRRKESAIGNGPAGVRSQRHRSLNGGRRGVRKQKPRRRCLRRLGY